MTIAPQNFVNQRTIDANGETLTIGYDSNGTLGSWSNDGGIIELSGNAALVLDGSLASGNIGLITGASGVTEIGLLDNTGVTWTWAPDPNSAPSLWQVAEWSAAARSSIRAAASCSAGARSTT